jgi:hypothetical protein
MDQILGVVGTRLGNGRVDWIVNNGLTRIRYERHTGGDYVGPRHSDWHYNVQTRAGTDVGWNNTDPEKMTLYEPPGYIPDYGRGFLPGEDFPIDFLP